MKHALAILLAGTLLSAHAAEIPVEAGSGVWLQLLPAGSFNGRDGRGPYHAGDRQALEQIVAVTRAFHGTTDIVFDYEHQSLNTAENGKPAPAAGWIKEVEARDDGLYGRVEWTAAAAGAIEAKEYRYLSPVFFHTPDGEVLALQNVALTNTPNLNLFEVSAHSFFSSTPTTEVPMKKVLAALGLAAGASEDDVLIAINSLLTSSTAIAVAAGLTKDAKSDEVVAKVSAMRSSATPDPTKFVPIEQVQAMQADIKALQDRTADADADADVAQAIKDGKVAPALKEWALALHKADRAKFDEFIGKAPVLTSVQRAFPAKTGGVDDTQLDDNQLAVAAAMGVDAEAFKKTLAAEAAEREAR